jgi:parallel beta-helix repeat protein
VAQAVGTGSATRTALAESFVPALTPAAYGAAGDGTADDATAVTAMYASAFGDTVRFERGRTYKLGSSATITKDTDLNGATVNITGRLNLASGATLKNGTVIVTDKVNGAGLSNVTVQNVTVTNGSGGNGIYLSKCTDVKVENCRVSGGTRGIILDACDRFRIAHNTVQNITANGAYGILVTGKDGETHGGGVVFNNDVIDCFFGIALYGGEADSTKAGFLPQYNLENIEVVANRVTVTTPDTLIGCIWATRASGITYSANIVTGGYDVGLDFEYCTKSVAAGNIVTDVLNGGLAAIFGSSYITFEGNRVEYRRTKAGSASTVNNTWKNTSNLPVLLRDNPAHITLKGNTFTVANGTLGKVELGAASSNVTFEGNRLHNCYVAGANTTAGAVKATNIEQNVFTFDVNINNSVIYHERVQDFHANRNTITLASGEVPESDLRYYIEVRDASGGGYSSLVYIAGNQIDDKGANHGIGLHTGDPGVKAWITQNITDRVTALYATGTYTNLVVSGNTGITAPTLTGLTAHDTPGLAITAIPFPNLIGGALIAASGGIATKDGVNAMRVDTGRNLTFSSNSPSYGGGAGVQFVGNTSNAPTSNPTGGGIMYSHVGAGRWRTANGSVVTFAGDVTPVSANYTAGVGDRTILATAGTGITVTLPAAVKGYRFEIVKVDNGSGAVSVVPSSGQKINGSTTPQSLMAQYSKISVVSDGTDWFIL